MLRIRVKLSGSMELMESDLMVKGVVVPLTTKGLLPVSPLNGVPSVPK